MLQAIELPEHLKGPARILRKTCQAEIQVSEGNRKLRKFIFRTA